MDAGTAERIRVHELADEAWHRAWNEARDEDARLGRRYDKRIYSEKAHLAAVAVLSAHPHIHKPGRKCLPGVSLSDLANGAA